MSLDLDGLPAEVLDFLTERHLATLTTLRRDGSPHVVPVGFTYDAATRFARVITSGESVKARNAAARAVGGRDVPGGRRAVVDRQRAGAGGHRPGGDRRRRARYAARYRQPRVNPYGWR